MHQCTSVMIRFSLITKVKRCLTHQGTWAVFRVEILLFVFGTLSPQEQSSQPQRT